MGKVIFLFDKEKDIHNYYDTINPKSPTYGHDFTKSVPQRLKDAIKGKTYVQSKKEILKFNSKLYKSKFIPVFKESIEKVWSNIEKEYIKRVENITKRKFVKGKIKAYIITDMRCPYSPEEKYFMVSIYHNLNSASLTIGHELFHLQFHEYFWGKTEKELGYNKTHDLKEALTVLLNLEFQDLWFWRDQGYDSHKKIRQFITEEWKKEKDFEKLIDKCINFMKNQRDYEKFN